VRTKGPNSLKKNSKLLVEKARWS